MDARIILQGQQLDVADAMARGNALAQQVNDMRRQRAINDLYQQQGAGILAGDQNALNALAAYDPMAAYGLKSDMRAADMRESEFGMRQKEFEQRMTEYASGLSAAEAQAKAAAIERAVAAASAAQTPEEWDRLVTQFNAPDLVGQFQNKDAHINSYLSMADILKRNSGASYRPATADEAAQYGSTAGQFGSDGRFYPINPPSGMRVETGPDGQVRVVQGPGVTAGTDKPFTEGQSKDNVYSTRARGALEVLEPVADTLPSRKDRALGVVPFGFGRDYQSEDFQVAQQAGEEFLTAILRKDTGAAITTMEQDIYGVVYLPQPGDGPAVLEAKREARIRAVAALEAGMSPAQMLARDKALVSAAKETAGAKPSNSAGPQPGTIEDGFQFIGGNPADPNNWQKVE